MLAEFLYGYVFENVEDGKKRTVSYRELGYKVVNSVEQSRCRVSWWVFV